MRERLRHFTALLTESGCMDPEKKPEQRRENERGGGGGSQFAGHVQLKRENQVRCAAVLLPLLVAASVCSIVHAAGGRCYLFTPLLHARALLLLYGQTTYKNAHYNIFTYTLVHALTTHAACAMIKQHQALRQQVEELKKLQAKYIGQAKRSQPNMRRRSRV